MYYKVMKSLLQVLPFCSEQCVNSDITIHTPVPHFPLSMCCKFDSPLNRPFSFILGHGFFGVFLTWFLLLLLFSIDFLLFVVVVSNFISLSDWNECQRLQCLFFLSLFISPHSGGKKNSDSIMEVAASVPCKFSVFIVCALVEDDECCGLLEVMNIMTD